MGNCFHKLRKMNKCTNLSNPRDPNKVFNPPPTNVLFVSKGSSSTGVTDFINQRSHPLPVPSPSQQIEKNRNGIQSNSPTESQILSSPDLKSFLYSELNKATQDFHPDNHLGEGGFGNVYKGWLDEETLNAAKPGSGMEVAVKKLRPQALQGHKEWLSEVNYLGRLHHPNLVNLIGFCLEGENRLLVYEFMSKGSLENHLFKRSAPPISWATRVKIAVEAARGLCFLHDSESQIIYRDLKASNILLDSEFNAKLSDFGLAKSGPTGDQTHVTTIVMGTEGYAAPEYIRTGRLNTKCDVYSFGVVLFELLTGRRAVEFSRTKGEEHLVTWVKPHLHDKRSIVRIMDNKLEGKYPRKAAFVAATLALHCVNTEHRFRPPMGEVLQYLEQLQSPKFMSMPSPPSRDGQSSSAPESPQKLSQISPADWSPKNRTPRQPSSQGVMKSHKYNSARGTSPAGHKKSSHRSRLSGMMIEK